MELDQRLAEFAFFSAAANWAKWREDFEFDGKPSGLPVLQSPQRFREFLFEYGLNRGIKKGCAEKVRCELSDDRVVDKLLDQDNECRVKSIVDYLVSKELTNGQQTSLVSKVATFAQPNRYVMCDKYVKQGVSFVEYEEFCGGRNSSFRNYANFVSRFMAIYDGEIGSRINSFVKRHLGAECLSFPNSLPGSSAFALRVLDVYLMVLGGRWSPFLEYPPAEAYRRKQRA
jgi:hypothetical protein